MPGVVRKVSGRWISGLPEASGCVKKDLYAASARESIGVGLAGM